MEKRWIIKCQNYSYKFARWLMLLGANSVCNSYWIQREIHYRQSNLCLMNVHPCWFCFANCSLSPSGCLLCQCCCCCLILNSSSSFNVLPCKVNMQCSMYKVIGRDETVTINGSVLLSTWQAIEYGRKEGFHGVDSGCRMLWMLFLLCCMLLNTEYSILMMVSCSARPALVAGREKYAATAWC